MPCARVSLLSSLFIAMIALPAGAQTPTPAPKADSVTDSTATKKKSRFGGLVNKAKQVAGNKAVQNAAKGAATGVASTVVPGAAAVSMATGSGPCANAGVAWLLKVRGVTRAATAVAGSAASGVAAKTAGQLTGVKGAAAAGALSAVGGQGGISNAAASAALSAMKPKTGAATAGNAASIAAAAAMMSGAGATAKKGATAKQVSPTPADMASAMAAMGAAMGAVNTATAGASKVETVDFRELKALLPETLRGMKRTEASGQKTGAMGIQISAAEGVYSATDGNSVRLTITDIGSLAGMAAAANYAWATNEIDREFNGGYEKTTTFKGFKALEKYNKQSRSGELAVLVEGRFIVGAEGSDVDMEAIKAAVGSVDLRRLAGMKGKGVK